jgi:hypothetical protein
VVRLTDPSGDETSRIQAAVDASPQTVLGPGTWWADLIEMRDDRELLFEDRCELWRNLSAPDPHSRTIQVHGVANVRVGGEESSRVGVQEDPSYGGQWRHAVSVLGSDNVEVWGFRTTSRGGEGVQVGGNAALGKSTDVNVHDMECDDSKRNGVGITYAEHVNVERVRSSMSHGIAAMSGMAIEPNLASEYARDINVTDCSFTEGYKHGLQVQHYNAFPSSLQVNVRRTRLHGRHRHALFVSHSPSDRSWVRLDQCVLEADEMGAVGVTTIKNVDVHLRRCRLLRRSGVPRLGDVYVDWEDYNGPVEFDGSDLSYLSFMNVSSPYPDFKVVVHGDGVAPGVRGKISRPGPRRRVKNTWLELTKA